MTEGHKVSEGQPRGSPVGASSGYIARVSSQIQALGGLNEHPFLVGIASLANSVVEQSVPTHAASKACPPPKSAIDGGRKPSSAFK